MSVMSTCGPFEYTCVADGSCIPEDFVCNGIADCVNRTDEVEEVCQKIRCPRYSFRFLFLLIHLDDIIYLLLLLYLDAIMELALIQH